MAGLFKRVTNSGVETALQSIWQMLGGMVWAAIGGAVVTGLSALIGYVSGAISPIWFDRAITGLVAFASIALFGILQAVARKAREPRTTTNDAEQPKTDPVVQPIQLGFTEIVNQTFKNQEVPLDGYRYISCIFENVTFVYNNGNTGGIDTSSRFTGSVGFKSREARIQQILAFLQSIKIIPPQTTHGLYTPILGDLPNPSSEASIIKTAVSLASHWSRLVSARQNSDEKFKDMENAYEYLVNFWNELTNAQNDTRREWFERNFPGQSLTPEDIDEFREKFLAGAKAARESLVTVLNLLAFQVTRLGA
jgi:hypothetical protein